MSFEIYINFQKYTAVLKQSQSSLKQGRNYLNQRKFLIKLQITQFKLLLINILKIFMFSKSRSYPRKSIFSDYSVPSNPLLQLKQNQPQKKSSNQDLLLRQITLFLINLKEVLSEKHSIMERMDESSEHIKTVNKLISLINQSTVKQDKQITKLYKQILQNDEYFYTLQKEITKRKLSEQDPKLLSALGVYKELLNRGENLKFQAQSFRVGTLSNFNPSHTQPIFIKSPQKAQQDVLKYIELAEKYRNSLMEARVRVKSNQQKDRFLLQQQKFDECFTNLQFLYDPKKVEEIHFDMLNILQAFDDFSQEYANLIESNEITIKQYQGVHDSQSLMTRQINEMKQTMKYWNHSIERLGQNSTNSGEQEKIYRKSINDEKQINQNLKIYRINQKNFSRYNTQTNLINYYEKRQKFVETLRIFQTRHARWVDEFQSIKSINTHQNDFQGLLQKRQREVSKNASKTTVYDNQLRKILNQVQVYPIKRGSKLIDYRNKVANKMKLELKRSGFRNIQTNQIKQSSDVTEQHYQKLQIYKRFFRQLENQKYYAKKQFLVKNIDKIQKFIFYNDQFIEQLQKEKSSLTKQFKKYNFAFKYCQQMQQLSNKITLSSFGENELIYDLSCIEKPSGQINQNLQNINKIIYMRWRQLPEAFTEFLFLHCSDYLNVSNTLQSQEWKQYKKQLKRIQQSNREHSDINAFIHEFVYRKYQQFKLNHLQIYLQSLLNVSEYSLQLLTFQDQFWNQSTKIFKNLCANSSVIQIDESTSKQKSIDKSTFYSITFLTMIIRKSSYMKVINLTKIIQQIVSQIEKKLHNWNSKQQYLQIIKLTLLLQYLQDSYTIEDRYVYQIILYKVRRFIIVTLLVDQYIINYSQKKSNEKEKSIEILIMIENYLPSTILNIKDEDHSSLILYVQKKMQSLKKQISPLVFSISKNKQQQVNLRTLKNIYSFQKWVDNWKSGKFNIRTKDRNLEFLQLVSDIYTKIYDLQDLIELSKKQWQENQSFLVRKKKNQNYYLIKEIMKLRNISKNTKIAEIINEIKEIFQFKNKPIEMSKSQEKQIKDTLQVLLKKLGKTIQTTLNK